MADALYTAANNITSHAPTASASLGTISAGSDVLVSNFAGLATLVDDLTALGSALKAGYYSPVGMVAPFAGASAPTGWLLCNGDTVPNGSGTVQSVTANFSDLYGVLAGNYGGAGKLPDLRGNAVIGVSASYGIGVGGGSATRSLGVSNLPAHTHTVSETSTGAYSFETTINQYSAGSGSSWRVKTDSQGGGYTYNNFQSAPNHTHSVSVSGGGNGTASGDAFSVMQPYLPLNYIIKF